MSDLDARHERLRASLREMQRVVIAYSGGVDSTLLLRVAVEVLGERAVGLCALSPSLNTFPCRCDAKAPRERAKLGALSRPAHSPTVLLIQSGYTKQGGSRAKRPVVARR